MKLLLTSAGIRNTSIHSALVGLVRVYRGGLRGVEATHRWRRDARRRRLLDLPHVNPEGMPGNSMEEAERWAAGIQGLAYAIDDETAIQVTDGRVEVVSEGHWTLFTPSREAGSSAQETRVARLRRPGTTP